MRWLVLLAVITAARPAVAAQAVALSVEDLARHSELVVRGRVAGVTAAWSGGEGRGRIYSTVELRTSSSWRGRAPDRVRVLVPGGAVGRIGERVDAAPSFTPGEEVIVFLSRAEAGTFRVNGLAQGKFAVTGREARPDLSQLTFVASRVGPGERRVEAMPLAELERRIRSRP